VTPPTPRTLTREISPPDIPVKFLPPLSDNFNPSLSQPEQHNTKTAQGREQKSRERERESKCPSLRKQRSVLSFPSSPHPSLLSHASRFCPSPVSPLLTPSQAPMHPAMKLCLNSKRIYTDGGKWQIQREHRKGDKEGTRAPVKANGLPVKAPKPTSIVCF
jgi:hypothetical protein